MSYVKIWIHAVWSTKNRVKILDQNIRPVLFSHIVKNGREKGIDIACVNGYSDHVHCLFKLRNDQTIMKTMQLIKGESSFWFNRQKLSSSELIWQKEYFAVSISESMVDRVKVYIDNQEQHHKKYSWEEEYRQFVDSYHFRIIKG